jgi:iron complex outermembrane receptor protein
MEHSRGLKGAVRIGVMLATVVGASVGQAQAPALGTVSGRVTLGEDGSAAVGASVVSSGAPNGSPNGALVRGDGTYRLQLRPGTYELRARLIGFASPRDTVVVTAGGTVTADFRLSRAASTLEAVAVVGSRTAARTVIESPVPVDVLSAADIRSTGRTETAQILQQLAPSVNFPRATVSDGTDHVRPATLRGLGADQVLVLINGKRRHTSALVNVNGSIGRGQAAVDLNAIPASMIDHIEVLRDGAAAQYGSDAIAGVINVVLKSNAPGEIASTLGQTATRYGGQTVTGQTSATAAPTSVTTPSRSAHDGRVVQVSANGALRATPSGFLYGGVEFRDRDRTNRTLGDPRAQSFAEAAGNVTHTNETGAINHVQGDAATTDVVGFYNGQKTLAGGTELYAFGGFGHRDGEAAGFFRRAQDDRTIRSLWPNGFLPLIQSDLWDASTFAGARGTTAGWKWDASTGYGRNSFRFDVDHSNNASLGNASPTSFYVGTLANGQWTTDLDVARELHVGAIPVRTALGAEFRLDQYSITAGDPASYQDGGVPVLDANGQPTTRKAGVGAQVFPGFRPSDAVDESRDNVGVYLDVESDLTKRLLVGGAVRYERYSDFGSATSGKLASRLTLAPGVVLRGAVNSGFRAPSLQQSFYSATATNFITINGALTPVEVKTAPVNSPVAIALGSSPLEPEKSLNVSGGIALEPTKSLALTVDYYHIKISDRIVLSENFVQTQQVIDLLRPFGAAGARYFTNAIDTRTNGVDVVANYGLDLHGSGFLRLTGGYNHTRTKATQVIPNPTQLGNQNETIFGRVERGRVEEGQPRDNVLASATYELHRFTGVVRTQRFGAVTSRSTAGSEYLDQTFGAKWVSDVSASYKFARRLTLTAGADNVLDVYPDQNNVPGSATVSGNSTNGIFPYSQFSPFGFNGRFVYVRASLGF